MDLTSYLLGKKSSGGGGSTLQNKNITITNNGTTLVVPDEGYDGLRKVDITTNVSGGGSLNTLTDVNNMLTSFEDYLNELVNEYTTYTNEPITIYTPDEKSTSFMIQKRSNGKYRIVWSNYAFYLCLVSNSSQSFCYKSAYNNYSSISMPITLNTKKINTDIIKGYYSAEFNTLEDLLLAIQNQNGTGISYTSYAGGFGYSGVLDSNWVSPISNLPVFNSDMITPFTNGRVLSHNTTILPISSN